VNIAERGAALRSGPFPTMAVVVSLSRVMALLVILAFIITVSINLIYHKSGYYDLLHRDASPVKHLLNAYKANKIIDFEKPTKVMVKIEKNDPRKLDGEEPSKLLLNCTAYGGPSNSFAQKEMVYWEDTSIDSKYVSPFKRKNEAQYLTFEPDHGCVKPFNCLFPTLANFYSCYFCL
jgi:hypothetical protein